MAAPSNIRNLGLLLGLFLPPSLPLQHGYYLFATLSSSLPLYQLHINQRRQGRQPSNTAWTTTIEDLLLDGLHDPVGELLDEELPNNNRQLSKDIVSDLEGIYNLLGIDIDDPAADAFQIPEAPIILVTARRNCQICPENELHTLRRRIKPQEIRILVPEFQWKKGLLFVAHCPVCRSDYYPDRYTFMVEGMRRQRLEYDTKYLRISKSGIWAFRTVAIAQEKAINRFRAGWSNFAGWINGSLISAPSMTNRQSQRLFLEHFSRRLLLAHGKHADFECIANPSASQFAEDLRGVIGVDGGCLSDAIHHGCIECTHRKRYRSDLIEEGAILDGGVHDVVEMPLALANEVLEQPAGANNLNLADPFPPVQEPDPENNEPRGYVRMAVMDGKTIGHRICALDTCSKPLVNYKNGRFCEEHLPLKNICGIIPCGRPISSAGSQTCNSLEHMEWHAQYLQRFSRLSYPGVRRVIRRQQNVQANPAAPTLRVGDQLPFLGNIPGTDVVHTFRAQSVYCIQTVQWACGIPVGWGKCYRSESSPQVFAILKNIWDGHDEYRPSFVAYDDACDLLRHIVTQDRNDPWLTTTKFIVDAWHYIGHRATDVLCRLWCNPAPANGSQPDLVLTEHDDDGNPHSTRAFNTITAEQLNSWLDGFESQLRQMSAVNFDVYMHALMLIYKESVEERIRKKDNGLPDDFWD